MSNSRHIPPKLGQRFLRWVLKDNIAEEVQGDLNEQFYSTLKNSSPFKAKLNYWYQVFNYMRPFAFRTKSINSNTIDMLQHNLLVSFRNFKRYKSSFFINLIGLSSGLACALLIYLWVNDELNIDNFHKNDTQLFQVMEGQHHNGDIRITGSTPWLLAESLLEEMPEVEFATVVTPFFWFNPFTLTVNDKNIKARGIYAGKDFFNVFSYDLLHGNTDQALSDKNHVVISEDIAMQLFGTTENIIGKALEFQHEREYFISGIVENVPSNSSMRFAMVLSVDILKDTQPEAFSWANAGPFTYVVLKKESDSNKFTEKIVDYISTKTESTHRKLFMARYSRTYLYNSNENGVQSGGRIEYVRLFSIIAIFILLIACINFMNLATSRASRRMKEVGIKKAVGAYRHSLVFQYLMESVLIAFLGLICAVFIVYALLPQFNQITGKNLTLYFDYNLILSFLSITLLTGLLAGSYPAIYLSSFKPVSILKGNLKGSLGELWVRKGLVVFQFAVTVIFIVSVVVIYKQIEYVQTRNIGYNRDNIIYFDIEGKIKDNLETFLSELRQIPGVEYSSSASESMVGGGNTTTPDWEGKDPEIRIPFAMRSANYGLPEMMELKFVAGRSFSRDFSDSMRVIFNVAGIEAMGMNDPVGKSIKMGPYNCEIIGVFENFNYESFRSKVKPLFFVLAPEHTEKVMVRIEAGKTSETLDRIGNFYLEYNPGFTFDYRFIDQDYQFQYVSEQRISTLSKYFGGIAIIISCLGLLGLATFTAERRLKEIGIRKILGSSVFSIVRLLSGDFTKMGLVAIVIALPISYFIAKNWLNEFVYRIDLEWWLFAGTGLIALFIVWLTVGLQTLKAARINPTKCLQDE